METLKYKYSVGIPVKNEENTIKRTIESVLNQSIPPEKIYICVNGSSDNTYQIVSDMMVHEPRIELLTSEPGKLFAWNMISRKMNTNYRMFCDGDVLIDKDAAKELMNGLENDSNMIISAGFKKYNPNQKETIFMKYFNSGPSENNIRYPAKQWWIFGGLYMINFERYESHIQNLGLELMPLYLRSDDQYLTMVTRNRYKIIETAVAYVNQIENLTDWFVFYKRVKQSTRQLKENFPQFFHEEKIINLPFNEKIKRTFKRIYEIDGFERKVGVTFLYILKRIIEIQAKYGRVNNKIIWREIKTTKKSL